MTDTSKLKRGDETEPVSKQSAEGPCPTCSGTGALADRPCADYDGTGVVAVLVGDA